PDVVFMRASNAHRRHNEYWEGADLVVEVVSSDDPKRDLVEKKAEYASAGIPEYWIADPRDKMLTIFTLDDGATEYREAGRYQEGETAKSLLLAGLTVDVTAVFTGE
ncbi:MAG: Uma2 family endonuclease, partial [Planctomycetota bacterium]|nr:Uma2 family endonuclease [Planctomycetota bacterium]